MVTKVVSSELCVTCVRELSVSGGLALIRVVSTSTSQRVPWGRVSFLPVSSPETNRRLTVAADRPSIRDASVTVNSPLAFMHPYKERSGRSIIGDFERWVLGENTLLSTYYLGITFVMGQTFLV